MNNLQLWQIICTGSLFFLAGPVFSQVPESDISNGLVNAKVYLPDPAKGYYQGTRFDWSGVIASLEYKGHSYFGKWFEKYDPKIHDAITGPVEAFDPVGFEEAQPGEVFLKIGVGSLRKPDEKRYQFTVPYEVVDYGEWSVKERKNELVFIHNLNDASGYSYEYQKNLKLVEGKPELILEHIFKNTGKKKIETRVYNHNFFMIDDQRISSDFTITFPFNLGLKGNSRGVGDLVTVTENQIRYLRTTNPGESVMLFLEGFGKESDDYQIQIENNKTGAGVRISSDQPMSDLAFWSIHTTLCPEPYTSVKVDPGKEAKWTIKYEFYTLEDL